MKNRRGMKGKGEEQGEKGEIWKEGDEMGGGH